VTTAIHDVVFGGAAGSVGMVRTLDNFGRPQLRLHDRYLYGRSTDADRDAWRVQYGREAAEGIAGLFGGFSAEQCAAHRRAAAEYGRSAYHYACGWYDALKGERPDWWGSRAFDLAWYFGEECERADYMFRTERVYGGRQGFGGAWDIARAVHLL
jgi:hypothetical protein